MRRLGNLILISFVVSLVKLPQARAIDVLGPNTAIVVEQTKSGRVTFQLCSFKKKACETLGRKSGYTQRELQEQRVYEHLEASGILLIAGGLIVATPYVWAYGWFNVIGTSMAGGAVNAAFYLMVGTTGGMLYAVYRGVRETIAQFRQTRVLRDEIIQDRDLLETDEKVVRIAGDLRTVLEKI